MQPIEQFKQAVRAGQADQLSQLLELHPELKTSLNDPLFSFDSPAIVQAASRGSRELVDVLLDAGADINRKSSWWAGGFGVLDIDDHEMAGYLIQRGAIVDIHAAARHGMLDRVKAFISADPELVHARGGDGQLPLHFASTVEIAAYLLDHGADIDARDVDHESTAAQYRVRSHPEIVRYLIRRGCQTDILIAAALGDADLVRKHLDADPGCIRMYVGEEYFPKRNPRSGGSIYIWTLGANRTAHQIAWKFGHPEIVNLLMDRSPTEVKLINACAIGDEATIKSLRGSHPGLIQALSATDRDYIVRAAEDNNIEAVRLMLESGWPVDGGRDATPLHFAAWHGNAEMTRLILRYNPPLEQTDRAYHATPLGWAIHGSEHGWNCKTGDYAGTVEALLEAGAKAPEEAGGSEAVGAVLRRSQSKA